MADEEPTAADDSPKKEESTRSAAGDAAHPAADRPPGDGSPTAQLDPDTFEAYFHLRDHRVAGVRLQPLDLYRCLALEAINSPYTAGRPAGWDDCAKAVLICSARTHREVGDIVTGQNTASQDATLAEMADHVFDPSMPGEPEDRARIALAAFSAYWADYYPTYQTTTPARAGGGRVQGSLYLRLACFLMSNTGRSAEAAWWVSPGEALQELITIAQQNGAKITKLDLEETAILRELGHDV